jgi:hypothetical protein
MAMKRLLIALLALAAGLAAWPAQASLMYLTTDRGYLYTHDTATGRTSQVGRTGPGMTDVANLGGRLYATDFTSFYQLDPATGASTYLGPNGNWGANTLVANPADGLLYTADFDRGDFGSLSPAGEYTHIGNFNNWWNRPHWRSSGDLAFGGDGTLYGTVYRDWLFGPTDSYLARVDLATGKADIIGTTGHRDVYGLVYLDDTLYGVSAQKRLLTIDPVTGAGSVVAKLSGLRGRPWGAAPAGGGAEVPEPATLLLVGSSAGLLGLLRLRRRRG